MSEEAKPKAKAKTPRDSHLEQLELRKKNLQAKISKRIPHFSEGAREQAMDRAERDLVALNKLIAKAKKE